MKSDNNHYWSMTEGVFNCLIDDKRTRAFRKAIRNTVRKGDVVVDLGSGSGVMAMFAAEAGARKVYAVEIDKRNIRTLRDTFASNGYADTITVLEGDATKVRFPEKPDVIIGEMVATGLIEELQIPAMNNALRYARKKPRVVLKRIDNYVDLVFNNPVFYGHTFNIIRYGYPDLKELESVPFSKRIRYASVDFSKTNTKNKVSLHTSVTVTKNGTLNGVRISSDTIFHDRSTLGATYAYCYPIILPVPETKVSRGDRFSLTLGYDMCGGFKTLTYSLTKKHGK